MDTGRIVPKFTVLTIETMQTQDDWVNWSVFKKDNYPGRFMVKRC